MNEPLLLETLCGCDNNSNHDGLYSSMALTAAYADPCFANLQFLCGNLGGIQGTEESFTVQAMPADEAEHFLLFEMNDSTYVILQNSLMSITTSHNGPIIPFLSPFRGGS